MRVILKRKKNCFSRNLIYSCGCCCCCCSVAQSCPTDSLRPHGLQHARPPCPSPSPGACSNSCPLSQWCHPTISSFVVPFSHCLQSFPASGSLWISSSHQVGQSINVSASVSVLPMNIQDWFPLGWTDLISLQLQKLDCKKKSFGVQVLAKVREK